MSSTTINLKVIDQTLTMIGTPVVASGGINEDYLLIDFDSSWDNLAKIAIFYKKKGEIYYSLVNTENKCIVPQEVIATKGFMYLGICGVYDDLQKTTQVIKYQITNGSLDSIEIEEPTPNIYMQIMFELSNIRATAQQLSANEQAFEESIQSQFDEYKLEVPTIAENTATQIVNNLMGDCNTSIANLNNATRINLLKPTLGTTTINNVICTNNGDGTYTLNGTASELTYFNLAINYPIPPNKKIKFFGCPKGGTEKNVLFYNNGLEYYEDRGSGNIIYSGEKNDIFIRILSGFTCNNLVYKPMITTNLNATYDDFVSYEDSLATNRVMSTRVNLLKPVLQTTTKNGVICINNNDGTYTLNGISQNAFDFPLCNFELPKGTYKFVGSLRNNGDYFMYVINHTLNENYIGDVGNGYIFTINQTCNLTFLLWGKQNITFNNLLFKPMLTTNLNATYDDFVSCLGTSWTQDTTNGYYTQTIACNGITSKDNPPIDVVLSGNLTEMQSQQEEWGKILKIETSSNTLKFFASEPTTVSLSVIVKGV